MSRVTGIALALFIGATCTAVVADTPETAAANIRCLKAMGDEQNCPLAGHTDVKVIIERLNKSAEDAGLNQSRLKTTVELKLRTAGMSVSSKSRDWFYVRYVVVPIKRGEHRTGYSIACVVTFEEGQRIVTDENSPLVWITTWDNIRVGATFGNDDVGYMIDSLSALVDEFLNGWLMVNPR